MQHPTDSGCTSLTRWASQTLLSIQTETICFAVMSRLEYKQPIGEACPSHSGEVNSMAGRRESTCRGERVSEREMWQGVWRRGNVDSLWSRCPRWRWRTLGWTCPGRTEPAVTSCPPRCPPPGLSAERVKDRGKTSWVPVIGRGRDTGMWKERCVHLLLSVQQGCLVTNGGWVNVSEKKLDFDQNQ